MPTTTTHQRICAAISFGLGAWAFYKTQQVSGPSFEPIIQACSKSNVTPAEFAQMTGYHEYEPMLGFGIFRFFVCLITQFLHKLAHTHPGGFLMWMLTFVVAFPVGVLVIVEAGRAGSWGPIRYPIIFGLLYQLLGISVIFPLLWVPFYIFGQGTGGVSKFRAWAAAPMNLPGLLLSIAAFIVNTKTYIWTVVAGILGGPALALTPILLWGDKEPPLSDSKAIRDGADIAAKAYAIAGILSLLVWVFLLFVVFAEFGFHPMALYAHVWSEADSAVAFMTIDATVLWLGLIVCIASRKLQGGIEALLLAPIFGPGGAAALVLAGLEIEKTDATIADEPDDDQQQKTKKE